MDLWSNLTHQYRAFALQATDSPCFSAWSAAVARDLEVLDWLATLPRIKQQPNLVFAAARWHGVEAPGPYDGFRAAVLGDVGDAIRHTIFDRSTQTNEVGRLATLVPAMGLLQPDASSPALSLIEIGASAGLCLYPDRYRYRWSTDQGDVVLGRGPEISCQVRGPAPLPTQPVRIARRAGLDLNPLDVTDDEAMRWLENLIWPEHDDRRSRLRTAIEIARHDPPRLTTGDLLRGLPDLIAEAGRHGPVVVFHSAVIAYLDGAERTSFDHLIRDLVADDACHWISNESMDVLPSVTSTGPRPAQETFVLGIDGRAAAWTHGHGRSMHWLERP
ncbi:DUF2332 domain-containing protein [Aeromicrobium sp. CF3.5]|uniref:DUF2332 domain-containing protein n=1 Tax=Aeromicrobium sp. CF3.5 TaxID=3373078 RepID=UPI003EE46079